MTFQDWVRDSAERYRSQPLPTATRNSAQAFARGVVRRTIDPHVGRVWWERDWDVLILMDATRVDLARETLDVPVGSVWSPASTSIDWIERHFAERYRDEWSDAAYVTANPFADHNTADARSVDLSDKPLGYFDPVYKRAWSKDGIGTTPPEAVTDAAIDAWRSYDGRLIVHYMQPHQPFRSRPEWEHVYGNLENLTTDVNQGGPDIWKRCRDGEIGRGDLWAAYRDNLRWVWQDIVERLLPTVDGADVLISADHGNGMGEWGVWSHPPATLVPAVRKVPVIDGSDIDYDSDAAVEYKTDAVEAGASGKADEQLAALGYLSGP